MSQSAWMRLIYGSQLRGREYITYLEVSPKCTQVDTIRKCHVKINLVGCKVKENAISNNVSQLGQIISNHINLSCVGTVHELDPILFIIVFTGVLVISMRFDNCYGQRQFLDNCVQDTLQRDILYWNHPSVNFVICTPGLLKAIAPIIPNLPLPQTSVPIEYWETNTLWFCRHW